VSDLLVDLRRQASEAQQWMQDTRDELRRAEAQEAERQEAARLPGVRLTAASDYASLTAGTHDFYYGYEFGIEPDPDDPQDTRGVWGFSYRDGERTVARISYDELRRYRGCPNQGECAECLLFGIGVALRTGQVLP